MSEDSTAPEQALIAHLAQQRDHSLSRIRRQADAEAAALLAEARRRARARLQDAVAEERRRAERELRGTTARAETRLRQRFHETALDLLERTMPLLAEALEQRWQDAAARRRWLDDALELARRRLPAGSWTVEHPPGLAAEELRAALGKVSVPQADLSVEPRPAPELSAGIRVHCGGARLDASPAGLLVDPERIQGLLLARLEGAGALRDPAAED